MLCFRWKTKVTLRDLFNCNILSEKQAFDSTWFLHETIFSFWCFQVVVVILRRCFTPPSLELRALSTPEIESPSPVMSVTMEGDISLAKKMDNGLTTLCAMVKWKLLMLLVWWHNSWSLTNKWDTHMCLLFQGSFPMFLVKVSCDLVPLQFGNRPSDPYEEAVQNIDQSHNNPATMVNQAACPNLQKFIVWTCHRI